jgi:putative (di)nucleoside polyphosphate hydrolase
MWFAYRFLGTDSEINITPGEGLEPEFVEWRWTSAHDLLDLIVPFKRAVYREVLMEFAPLARPTRG